MVVVGTFLSNNSFDGRIRGFVAVYRLSCLATAEHARGVPMWILFLSVLWLLIINFAVNDDDIRQ